MAKKPIPYYYLMDLIISNSSNAATLGPFFSCPFTPKHVLICPTLTPVLYSVSKYFSINISVSFCFCTGPKGLAK